MSRSHRLFQLMQCLRNGAGPKTAASLSDEFGISARTVHRDIGTLREMGAVIDGAAGYGFTLIEDAALRKLQGRLPPHQSHRLSHAVLTAKRFWRPETPTISVSALRHATWEELEVRFAYTDMHGAQTYRQVRPLGISYLDRSTVLIGWCLLREDSRVFRLDRMRELELTETSFRPQRVPLLRAAQDRFRREIAEAAKACKAGN